MTRSACLVLASILLATTPARADEEPGDPDEPLRRSYAIAILESAGLLAGMNIGAQLIGKDYARISFSSIADNIRSEWVWDEDAFTTNNFGHPYQGTLYYQAARTNGFGILGSAIFTYVSSFVWELAMETETPSLNDQIVTPAAGILLGEALHRWSKTLRYPRHGARRTLLREVLATVMEPLGTINRVSFGDAWRMTPPPPSFGYLSLGINGFAVTFDATSTTEVTARYNLFHGALAFSYGLPAGTYAPRKPFDHFDVRVEGSVSPDEYFASLRMRTLLYGWGYGNGRVRGVWGAFGAYDFENPPRLRVGAASLGIGTTLHADLTPRTFLQGTATLNVIPYGSAGGDVPGGSDRDYHRGPGASQLVEVRVGVRDLGLLRVTAAGYEIDGSRFQEGSEILNTTRLELLWGMAENHALGLGMDFGLRRATFADDMPSQVDRSGQIRLFYALISGREFGGGQR